MVVASSPTTLELVQATRRAPWPGSGGVVVVARFDIVTSVNTQFVV
jgi:hypothetical protein